MVCLKFSKIFHVRCGSGFVVEFFELFLHHILNVWQKWFDVILRHSFCADFGQNFDDRMSAAEEFPLWIEESVTRYDNWLNHWLRFDGQVEWAFFKRQQCFCVSKWDSWKQLRNKIEMEWNWPELQRVPSGKIIIFDWNEIQKQTFNFAQNSISIFYLFLVDGFWLLIHGVSRWLLILPINKQSSPQITSKAEGEQVENFLFRHLRCSSDDRP